jgi:hypothetical protein
MNEKPKYIEQYERVKRCYQRLQEIENGRIHDRSSDFYDDEFLTFFLNCYHLKDWIKNDDSVPQEFRGSIEKFIEDNNCFHYCADIANGAKHLKLNKRRRVEKDIIKGPRHFILELFEGMGLKHPIIRERYSFQIGDQIIDGFKLSTECI